MKTPRPTTHSYLVFNILTLIAGLPLAFSAQASSVMWSINADGVKQVDPVGVPSQGDPDGTAIGTLALNDGTGGNTGFATVSLTLANLDFPLGAWHIHQGPSTGIGNIVLDFGAAETFRSGNSLSGTINNLSSATIDSVFANSAGFYFNLHSPTFPSGAVRDQLTIVVPEPSTVALVTVGLAALAFRRVRQLISSNRS